MEGGRGPTRDRVSVSVSVSCRGLRGTSVESEVEDAVAVICCPADKVSFFNCCLSVSLSLSSLSSLSAFFNDLEISFLGRHAQLYANEMKLATPKSKWGSQIHISLNCHCTGS